MKFALIAAVSILSTIASSLALPGLTPRAATLRPAIGIVIKEDSPTTAFPPTNNVEVSRKNGAHNVETLLGFVIPACTGHCTLSFSDATTATGSRKFQLFTTGRYPAFGDSWVSRPSRDVYLGTFLVSSTGAGPAVVVDDFGLTFQCPSTTTNQGYNLVPAGDDVSITWDITKGGLIITCS